ncbi:porin family protein [Cecembia sp.]|uniref:porin family protein n=1 Tax=Cecembia sp. TaxID=1898110 RepID=UPI0025BBDF80|nr:porin family protein [Cecembia sp.]
MPDILKNLSALLIFFVLFTSSLNAQDTSFGIRVGPSFTTVSGEFIDRNSFIVGYHAGGYVNIRISEHMSIEPGLQWATKGASNDLLGGPGGPVELRSRNSYLDIPILLKYDASKSVFFLIGAQPSFLLNSAMIIRVDEGKTVDKSKSIKDSYNDFDFAGLIGLGFNLGLGINLQLNYEHGLVNIRADGGSNFNRGFKFSLGKTF